MTRRDSLALEGALDALLCDFPAIIDLLQQRDPTFEVELLGWIVRSEEALLSCSHPSASELAGLRGRLLARSEPSERRARSKARLADAALAADEGQRILQQILVPLRDRLDERRQIAAQMVEAIALSGALSLSKTPDFGDFVYELWNFMQRHEQLGAGASQLRHSLNETDILQLIGDVLDLRRFAQSSR